MNFQPGKHYKTCDGSRARVYTTDGGGRYPIHGAIKRGDKWEAIAWTEDGKIIDDATDPIDLTPEEWSGPVKVSGWVNVYHEDISCVYATKNLADASADRFAKFNNNNVDSKRIACVYVEGVERREPEDGSEIGETK